MSSYEVLMADLLARLQATGSSWTTVDRVRRAHRTALPRDGNVLSGVHLIDGADEPAKTGGRGDCARRSCAPMVSLFIRSDEGPAAADPFKREVMRRLNPATQPYAAGTSVTPGRITIDAETGDKDPLRVDMEFAATYQAAEWEL